MKILIPYDITTTGMSNPYLFLLMRELYQQDAISEIQHGLGWLYETGNWDLIHLHWPEILVKSQLWDSSQSHLLEEKHFTNVLTSLIRNKKNGSKVITTIHNEKPHKDPSGRFEDLYREIYQLSDGFIHMGEFSKKKLEEEYPAEMKDKPSFIIPHGDYSYFPDEMKRSECREKLNIAEDKKLLLSFGAIRSQAELELGIDAFRKAGINNSKYLIAGSIPNPYRSQPQHYILRRKLYANMFNRQIQTHERTVSPAEVQIYLKTADLLLIPRFNTMNSGNVALGFTFGKVVAGPGYGVIGEILNETGNPVFDPANIDSVSRAIRKGFELAEEGHGIKNKEFANQHMNWKHIAEDTFKAYQSVVTQ